MDILPNFSYKDFWDPIKDRSVKIASPVGQAQFLLSSYTWHYKNSPGEWLLMCRYANTIGAGAGNQEVRNLNKLIIYLLNHLSENRKGYVNPRVAREVEKEIILLTAPYFAEGCGRDVTPAMRMLASYEEKKPVFTQPERSLILNCAYYIGDYDQIEEIAHGLSTKELTEEDITAVCAEIEAINLDWGGIPTMEGLQMVAAKRPTNRLDLNGCESMSKIYPPFNYYPTEQLPEEAKLLLNGTILLPCECADGWWGSGLQRIDQTYAVPHYFKNVGKDFFEIADLEYQSMVLGQEIPSGPQLCGFC